MRATGKLVAAASASLAVVVAETASAQSPWAETPSPADLKLYPAKTEFHGPAFVRMRCAVGDDGRLTQCGILEETPRGYDLGAWALSLAPKFRATPDAVKKFKGEVTIPIRLLEADEPPLRAAVFQVMRAYKHLGDPGPYYPDRAARGGVTGVVLMDCRVAEKMQLQGCKVAAVSTPDFGFEFAALKMAERGWMTAGPIPEGVSPADGVWRFKVVFAGRRR